MKKDPVRYYTFEIDGKHVGFYEESDVGGELLMNARMEIDGEAYENPFGIRHVDGRVTTWRVGDSDWRDFNEAEGVYPGSALPLLAPRALENGSFTYTPFHEGRGEVDQPATLEHRGDGVVVEIIDGEPGRRVVFEGDTIVEYGWGGTARSVLCDSREDAVRGTRWETEE